MIRVVVIDDDVLFTYCLQVSLEQLDTDVVLVACAHDARSGVSAVQAHQPDVVLIDFDLPNENGFAACTAIKAAQRAPRTLLVSGVDHSELVTEAIAIGFDGHVSKSASIEGLLDAIHKVHVGESVFSAQELAGALKANRRSALPNLSLSSRELEVLALLDSGSSTHDMVLILRVSEHTVRSHIRSILAKLGAHTRLEALAVARRDRALTQRINVVKMTHFVNLVGS